TLVSLLVGYKDIAKPTVAEAALDDVTTADTSEVPLETATYGVMTGTVAEIYIGKTYPNAKISIYTATPDAFVALSNGKIDYVMTPYTTAVTAIRNNDALCIYQNNVEKEKIACGVSKDNEALRDNIDAVLTTFKKDGTLDQIIANWTVPDKDYVLDDVPVANGKNGVLRVAINADREPM
ncbi:MAG: transporter substrate-binding domain-containing protein, partial [Lachnospiraceae bacterium]